VEPSPAGKWHAPASDSRVAGVAFAVIGGVFATVQLPGNPTGRDPRPPQRHNQQPWQANSGPVHRRLPGQLAAGGHPHSGGHPGSVRLPPLHHSPIRSVWVPWCVCDSVKPGGETTFAHDAGVGQALGDAGCRGPSARQVPRAHPKIGGVHIAATPGGTFTVTTPPTTHNECAGAALTVTSRRVESTSIGIRRHPAAASCVADQASRQ